MCQGLRVSEQTHELPHLFLSVWDHGQGAKAPFGEEPEHSRILGAGQEVFDLGRQLGDQRRELVHPLTGNAKDLGGLGVCPDRLVLEDPEPSQPLQDGVVTLEMVFVLGPLAGRDPGDRGQFLGFLAADENAMLAVSPCVERSSFPDCFRVSCSGFVPAAEPFRRAKGRYAKLA